MYYHMFIPCWKTKIPLYIFWHVHYVTFLDIINTVELILLEYISQESAFWVSFKMFNLMCYLFSCNYLWLAWSTSKWKVNNWLKSSLFFV